MRPRASRSRERFKSRLAEFMATGISHPLDGGPDTSCTVIRQARCPLRLPMSRHRGKRLLNGGEEFLGCCNDVASAEQPDLGL